jgi:hypothetical protein
MSLEFDEPGLDANAEILLRVVRKDVGAPFQQPQSLRIIGWNEFDEKVSANRSKKLCQSCKWHLVPDHQVVHEC